jgi:hypothetical protein
MTAKRAISTALATALAVVGLTTTMPTAAQAAATIVIINNDGAGVGFNDPTPVAPVGGNPGTTLGEQRMNVFVYVAGIWAANLDSSVSIVMRAQWTALSCNASSAVLGSAGAVTVSRDFSGAPRPGTWYSAALANKLFGADLVTTLPDLNANFNVNLGQTGCLTGVFFYLGLDRNHGTNIDLATVVLHEMGHGLGFQTFTSGTTGDYFNGFPSVYDYYLLDTTANLDWTQMTPAQRAASAINSRRLVWTGANVTGASNLLQQGTPQLVATAPSSLVGNYLVGTASFGPPLSEAGTSGEVMPVVAQTNDGGRGCQAFNTVNRAAVNGKIALIDRGGCVFTIKTKNAQDAGAIGVIIADNATGSPPAGLGGADPTITIPAVRITQADGNRFKDALKYRSRTRSGVFSTMNLNMAVRAGADAFGRLMMYTPNPYQGGSSVSHYDTSATPNLLMEPAINADLTHRVSAPFDLTLELLRDVGW